jgi:hypothetical protein
MSFRAAQTARNPEVQCDTARRIRFLTDLRASHCHSEPRRRRGIPRRFTTLARTRGIPRFARNDNVALVHLHPRRPRRHDLQLVWTVGVARCSGVRRDPSRFRQRCVVAGVAVRRARCGPRRADRDQLGMLGTGRGFDLVRCSPRAIPAAHAVPVITARVAGIAGIDMLKSTRP